MIRIMQRQSLDRRVSPLVFSHVAGIALVVVPCLAAAGCSSRLTYPVQGAVTHDSVPVVQGTITFEPADGKGPTAGGLIKDGRYAVVCAAPGGKVVRITATRETGRKIAADPVAGAPMVDEIESFIPEGYNVNSKLRCDIAAAESNAIDFHLTSP
jgi:hypothetical protein